MTNMESHSVKIPNMPPKRNASNNFPSEGESSSSALGSNKHTRSFLPQYSSSTLRCSMVKPARFRNSDGNCKDLGTDERTKLDMCLGSWHSTAMAAYSRVDQDSRSGSRCSTMNVFDWAFMEPSMVVGSMYCKRFLERHMCSIVKNYLQQHLAAFVFDKWAGPYKHFLLTMAIETDSTFFSNWSIADPPVAEAVGHCNAAKATSADRLPAAGMGSISIKTIVCVLLKDMNVVELDLEPMTGRRLNNDAKIVF